MFTAKIFFGDKLTIEETLVDWIMAKTLLDPAWGHETRSYEIERRMTNNTDGGGSRDRPTVL